MANVNIKPLGDRVLVHPLEEKEVKKGGIIIPDTAKEKPQEGEVVALGTGKRDDDGKLIEFTVKKGDRVLISKYGGTEVKIEGESYLIMREDDILGIISDKSSSHHPVLTIHNQILWQPNNSRLTNPRGILCSAASRSWRKQ
jgi:chaperonin GroES